MQSPQGSWDVSSWEMVHRLLSAAENALTECSDGKGGAGREGRGAWRALSGSGGVRVSRPFLGGAGPLADGSLPPEAWTAVAHSFKVGGYKLVGYA